MPNKYDLAALAAAEAKREKVKAKRLAWLEKEKNNASSKILFEGKPDGSVNKTGRTRTGTGKTAGKTSVPKGKSAKRRTGKRPSKASVAE